MTREELSNLIKMQKNARVLNECVRELKEEIKTRKPEMNKAQCSSNIIKNKFSESIKIVS